MVVQVGDPLLASSQTGVFVVSQASLTGGTTAVLIYHMTDTLVRGGPSHESWVVDSMPAFVRLLARCRATGVLVVYMVSDREYAIGAEVIPAIAPLPEEIVIRNRLSGAFPDTPFEQLLREQGRDTILITGEAVDRGCNTTARQALNLGLRPIMVRGACFTHDIADSPVGPVSKEDIERVHLASLHRHGVRIMPIDDVIAALA